jgi:hypothetical protein
VRDYEVYALVRYIVRADSQEDACDKVIDGGEFPLIPYDENNYCDDLCEVVAHALPSKLTASIELGEMK